MDFVSPREGNLTDSVNISVAAAKKHRNFGIIPRWSGKSWAIFISCALVILSSASYFGWKLFIWQPAVVNPFPTNVVAAMKFPIYYPTNIPSGYKIDTKSVTQPAAQVVVFDMTGPKGAKLYVSEEARPESFDLGGFYRKFQDLKEVPVSDGSIAVGTLNSGQTEVVSRANDKTWILSNTTANIPLDQLVTMLKSIAAAD